jgi:hypothetical protein
MFCKEMKFLLTQFQFYFLSLNVPTFSVPRHNSSRQLNSEPRLISAAPASSGSGAAAWYPLSILSTMAPCHPPSATPRLHSTGRAADHCLEPPQGVHGRGRHAWQPTTPRQTARPRYDGYASCRPLRRSSCHHAGLVLRPSGISTIAAGAAKNPPGNRVSPTLRGGFYMPRASSSFAASTKAVPAAPGETAYEDQPLTSFALLPRPVLMGSPC